MPIARAARPSRCARARLPAGTNRMRSSVHCRTMCAYLMLSGEPAEVLSVFGPQGERMHIRARPSRSATQP
jgi:hypothetical protein